MIKVYYKIKQGMRLFPLIIPNESAHNVLTENLLFWKKVLAQNQSRFVERVSTPEEADYILVPHDYKKAVLDVDYFEDIRQIATTYNKRLLLFTYQDNPEPIHEPNALVFRASAYKATLMSNEIIIPYLVEDLLVGRNIAVRKIPKIPVVGFVGFAGFQNTKQQVRATLKEIMRYMVHFVTTGTALKEKRKGVFIRKEMLSLLEQQSTIKTNFVIRDTYSGYVTEAHGEGYAEKIRNEYIDNIVDSDTTLSPRGDGNASQRFYEVLSLGRVPLLIDTDNELPLKDIIPYDEFVIRVPYANRKNVATYITNFYATLTDEQYEAVQRKARYYFETYLSFEAYYSFLFKEEYVKELEKQMYN